MTGRRVRVDSQTLYLLVKLLTISFRSGPKVKVLLCWRTRDLEGYSNARESAPANHPLAIAIARLFCQKYGPRVAIALMSSLVKRGGMQLGSNLLQNRRLSSRKLMETEAEFGIP